MTDVKFECVCCGYSKLPDFREETELWGIFFGGQEKDMNRTLRVAICPYCMRKVDSYYGQDVTKEELPALWRI